MRAMPTRIRDDAALDAALAAPVYLLFKHSHRCSISVKAMRAYEGFVESNPGTATGWVDVVEDRPLSQRAAADIGVEHKSPQALWLESGHATWHESHFAITEDALEAARPTASA